MAAELDLTEDTVRQRLSRGRKLLHEQVLAFVEGALEDSNPGKAFTVGVLAALPLLAASATGASVATAGGVAAKGSATAKTVTGVAALGAVLTGGVIFFFSLLGFLVFLGSCIGYIMGRAIRQSARQLEYATRFWRSLALGFAISVAPALLVMPALVLTPAAHPQLYQGMNFWMGLIYVLVPVALFLWLWRWWRESSRPGTKDPNLPQASRKRFLIWLALGMLVPAWLFGGSLYELAFKASLTSQRLSGAAFQEILSEHKDAQFSVFQYPNGLKKLSIRLPASPGRVSYWTQADDATLALLAKNHIAYKAVVAGQDAGLMGVPAAMAAMLLFLAFVLAPAGAVTLLMRPWRQVAYPPQIPAGQAERPDIRARNAFRTFAVATALALLAVAAFTGLATRWGTRALSAADLPRIVTEYRFARYVVTEYEHRRAELHITPRDYGIGPFVAPADATALALLKQRGIPYKTIVQGRDFGFRDPSPLFSLVCIVALIAGAVALLWWAGKGTRPWSPAFRVAFLVVFVLVFGASILLSRVPLETYASTARVQVAQWNNPTFPQDESDLVKSKEVLGQAVASLDLASQRGERKGGGLWLKFGNNLEMLQRLLWVDAIPTGHAGVIEITAFDNDAEAAAKVANAIAKAYLAYRNQSAPVARIMDAAVPENRPVSRDKPAMLVIGAVMGLLLGLLAGGAAAWVRARRRKPALEK